MSKLKIVSRHKGAIEWLKSEGFDEGEVIAQFTPEMIEAGDTIIGTLPIPLVKKILDGGATFILLSLPSIAFSQRGQELTPEEMTLAGARLDKILKIEMRRY